MYYANSQSTIQEKKSKPRKFHTYITINPETYTNLKKNKSNTSGTTSQKHCNIKNYKTLNPINK